MVVDGREPEPLAGKFAVLVDECYARERREMHADVIARDRLQLFGWRRRRRGTAGDDAGGEGGCEDSRQKNAEM
jgi:hypothetical protein